jgi:hypothetical protein
MPWGAVMARRAAARGEEIGQQAGRIRRRARPPIAVA